MIAEYPDVFEAPLSLLQHSQELEKKNQLPFLKCILIEAQYKEVIRRELQHIFQLDEASLMLDLDSQGRKAKGLYMFKR